jgi:aldose 1-epimerase
MKNYSITNSKMTLQLTPYGASMRYLKLCDGSEPLLSLASESDYIKDSSYAGTVIAPAGGRIKNAEITIVDKTFPLTKNEGENILHSGRDSSARRIWELNSEGKESVSFVCRLKDGTDGFPGNRVITAEYVLDNKSIILNVRCTTDKPTYFDPTTHAYWNFHQNKSALDHALVMSACYYWLNDKTFVPVTCIPVKNRSAFSFIKQITMNNAIKRGDQFNQLKDGRGYNNAFCASKAVLSYGSLSMTYTTDASCIWLYSGGYLDSSTRLIYKKNGKNILSGAEPSCGIALEGSDILNHRIAESGDIFKRTFSFTFDV